jgi:DNA polymerase III delta subunit
MMDNINNFKEEEIIDILSKLSDIDIDIKVNSLDKDKLLEMFFLSI